MPFEAAFKTRQKHVVKIISEISREEEGEEDST